MAKLFKIFSSLVLDTRKFTTSLKSASDRVTRFARNMEKTTARIGRSFKRAGKDLLFIGAAPAAALILSVKNYAAMADEIGKLAKQTGIATEALTEYQHVAAITGITFEKWVDAIRFMQDAISSTIGDAPLKRLGLDKESLKQLAPEAAFEKIVKALGDVGNAADRTGISLDLFGRSGSIILRLLGVDFDALREKARKLGLSFSKEETAAAEEFNDNLTRLKSTAQGLSFQVAKILIPSLDSLVVATTMASAGFKKWTDDNKSFSSGMVKVGTGFTALTIAAGGALFAVGQVSFALNSMLKLQSGLGKNRLAKYFIGAPVAILAAAAALLVFNKNVRDFIRDKRVFQEPTNFWQNKFENLQLNLQDWEANRLDRIRLSSGGADRLTPEEFMRRQQNRTELFNRRRFGFAEEFSYGPDYKPQARGDDFAGGYGKALVEINIEQLEEQRKMRESQASRDALGGSKMQPGGI